jgi:hypothetical protein
MKRVASMLAVMLITVPAGAEVRDADAGGFAVVSRVTVTATPGQVYAALGRIGGWWDPAHSWSGKAENLTLELRAGGCFCEALPDGGSVEHLRVVFAQPGKQLRLRGALGPLQGEGVDGALTWLIASGAGGTTIEQSYVVGGRIRGGVEKMAGPVDAVLAGQLARLKAYLDRPGQ